MHRLLPPWRRDLLLGLATIAAGMATAGAGALLLAGVGGFGS